MTNEMIAEVLGWFADKTDHYISTTQARELCDLILAMTAARECVDQVEGLSDEVQSAITTVECDIMSARNEGVEFAFVRITDLEPILAALSTRSQSPDVVIDLEKTGYQMLAEAAGQSNWIPPEYFANDWLADCAEFLRTGQGVSQSPDVEAMRELLTRWLRLADSGHFRDTTHLSLAAHPLADDTRKALGDAQ